MNSKGDVLAVLTRAANMLDPPSSIRPNGEALAEPVTGDEIDEARAAVAELIEAAGGGYDVRGETGMELVFDAEDRLLLRAALARVTGA